MLQGITLVALLRFLMNSLHGENNVVLVLFCTVNKCFYKLVHDCMSCFILGRRRAGETNQGQYRKRIRGRVFLSVYSVHILKTAYIYCMYYKIEETGLFYEL